MGDASPSEVMADSSIIMNVDSDLQDTEEIDNLQDNQDDCSDNIIKSITTAEKSEVIKFTRLPMSRIKHIMKMDPDVNLASNDAVFAVTKATEMFIESIAKECYSYTAKAKKKIVTKKDFDAVVDTVDCLSFLEGFCMETAFTNARAALLFILTIVQKMLVLKNFKTPSLARKVSSIILILAFFLYAFYTSAQIFLKETRGIKIELELD